MKTLTDQMNILAKTLNPEAKAKLIVTLRDLAYSLEDHDDTLHRLGYMQLQTAATRIGYNLGIFKILVNAQGPVTSKHLSEVTGTEAEFMDRFMNYLGSIGSVNEVAKNEYQANNVTSNLTAPMVEAGISHCFETIGPQYQALPAFMKETNYRCPTDPMHTVFQYAFKTDVHQFAWFSDHPENLRLFNDFMAFRRTPAQSWLTVYPVEEETKDWDPSAPVYVNIGGGIGHQCAQFKEKHPNVKGRVILQDLPHSIEKALPTPGVENMAHNFFEPQPVIGARLYFLRGVLHNHPDEKVLLILRNIVSAMTSDSKLLLDELVLPETGISDYGAALDLTMMAAFASVERTQAQWQTLFEAAGLKLVRTFAYYPAVYENVMEVQKL